LRVLAPHLAAIEQMLAETGVVEYRITSKNGLRKLKTKALDGTAVMYSHYVGKGLEEQMTPRAKPLTIKQRRKEARRLRKMGLTQVDIADKLGVSQKTISNDLAA
jgi:DNA-binding NarL/FixJ family response regulator